MNNSALHLYPEPSDDKLVQQFSLIGILDINAIAALEKLYTLPCQCKVELDFALLQRVNSMGLAQLLKLFEYWQQRHIHINIVNTNRMIAALFKMTGLNHFLADEPISTPAKPVDLARELLAGTAVKPTSAQILPFSDTTKNLATHNSPVNPEGKLKLWVNAQNNHQINGWYFFNTYLQRHLKREIQLQLVSGVDEPQDSAIETMDIVFTTPFKAARLSLEHHFQPLLRLTERTDEVTLLARADDPRQKLHDFCDSKVVTTSADNFVYLLGRFLLEETQPAAKNLSYVFSEPDIKALQMLLKGNADLLMMLTDTYQGLSGLTRNMLRVIDQSETGFAFHLLCLAPQCQELGEALSDILLKMNRDPQGLQVLSDLDIEGWNQPKPQEIYMMEMLFKRYIQFDGCALLYSSS